MICIDYWRLLFSSSAPPRRVQTTTTTTSREKWYHCPPITLSSRDNSGDASLTPKPRQKQEHYSSERLDAEITKILVIFEEKESEENWVALDETLKRFINIIRASFTLPNFSQNIRRMRMPIVNSVRLSTRLIIQRRKSPRGVLRVCYFQA